MPTKLALRRRLGEGASSIVWAADSPEGPVAVKVGRSEGVAGQLANEAERLLMVASPALCRVLGVGRVEPGSFQGAELATGLPYVVLQLAPGKPLHELSPSSAQQRRELALAVARDVGDALADLHALGSAHGDVKPSNIVVDRDKGAHVVRLLDLGLAEAADSPNPGGGTPRYLAPEVFEPGALGDGRARDLWALGVTLAELLELDVDVCAADRQPASGDPLAPLLRGLLARAPELRPSAGWVRDFAGRLSPRASDEPARRLRELERSYLAVRRDEILAAARHKRASVSVSGSPGEWLERALGNAQRTAELRGSPITTRAAEIGELSAHGRARWLVHAVGPVAAAWPALDVENDSELAERLSQAARAAPLERLTLAELQTGRSRAALDQKSTPVELALALAGGDTSVGVIDATERLVLGGECPVALALALARALRLRGEAGRALSLLAGLPGPASRVEAAEIRRRARDGERALLELDGVDDSSAPSLRAQATAIRARLLLDAGEVSEAIAELEAAPLSAAVLEVRALALLAAGQRGDAIRAALEARSLAAGEEEHARIEGVLGALAHAGGAASDALAAFERAAAHAARAGAILEEATYLTGVAAAAANLGQLSQTLSAAERATLLFEHLGRPRDAARAALARASVYAIAGASAELDEAAQDAMRRARASGDRRCRAYLHLARADALPAPDQEGLEHARRALALLQDARGDDVLRIAARRLRHGDQVEVSALDEQARAPGTALDARAEWWGARAEVLARDPTPERADSVLTELVAGAAERAPVAVRGPALAAAARLAERIGDGERARRFAQGAGEAQRALFASVPPALRTSLRAVPWIRTLSVGSDHPIVPEQLADIENLVHSLSRRDRLRPLLDQVLDALVLWTGVERGLLLLRAGDKLVPRAARNLAKHDLSGLQLELSHSLAQHALERREPVVAVDAAGELPEVHSSVHALKLRSVLAVPLVARGEALGVVYLDDRVRRGAFGPRELSWVRLVSGVAASAIADARDQLLLRRAVRRRERAEARLARELARREAELDLVERELREVKGARRTRYPYDDIVGESQPLSNMLSIVDRVTATDVPVLILGESGSGKELIARAMHENGKRRGRPFVSENCGAIPETLLETTLFGHVRGAFTGASRPRAGLFEVADGGTLFLDEIAEMSPALQTRFLRVLESGEVRPVGSERLNRVDVRVIGATHRDLTAMVKDGSFREDLFYRLNVISVRVPALRERPEDIPLLIRHFMAMHAPGRKVKTSKAALSALSAYGWPGNVRQLENEIRRALVLCEDRIEPEHLSEVVTSRGGSRSGASALNLKARVDALESELLLLALSRTSGNQTRAAELLGVSRFGLQKMIKRLSIDEDDARKF